MKKEIDPFIAHRDLLRAIINEREVLWEKLGTLNSISILYTGCEVYDIEIEDFKGRGKLDNNNGFGTTQSVKERSIQIYNDI